MYFSPYTIKKTAEVLAELKSSESGLSNEEVLNRQKKFGPNEVSGRQLHWWGVLTRQFKSPFIYLLLAAAVFSLFLGETLDGLMILLFVGINAILGFYQEYRSELTLKFLKQFIVSQVKVFRGGERLTVKSTELVPGDIVTLEPGDLIPADIRFLKTQSLTIDESILTGESLAVLKTSEKLETEAREIYQAQNLGFSATSVVGGQGTGVVLTTGQNTALGEIATLVGETRHESSFEKGLAKFSGFILRLIIFTLLVVILANILIKGPGVNLPLLLIFAVALAVSVIPEALLVVTTFSLSRGALRLAKNKVVVKRLSSIEDLGSIEVLCTDKTGTLTENKLKVCALYPKDNRLILLFASLANSFSERDENFTDSFDQALWKSLSEEDKKLWEEYQRVEEIPFDPERRRSSVLVRKDGQDELIVRGAPETILKLCQGVSDQEGKSFAPWVKKEGEEGKRVIAVARKNLSVKNLSHLAEEENELKLVGFVSFIDPLKKTAPEAILNGENLGVKIKILTGDSKEVAGAVAASVGLIKNPKEVLSGEEFDGLPDDKKRQAVEKFAVFARVSPSQKYQIIKFLQEKYEVGFLGEGINDAPALKAANVSIVVQSGTDIAKEASDIVLLHKSLNTVVDGIREGREIFANTAKYIKATLSSNFGNFYTVAIASLFIKFLPLLPLQILLINLLTDFPMIAVVTDNVDREELQRPRSYNLREIVTLATCLGIVSAFFDFIFFALFYRISPSVLQTNWFIGSVLTELVFLFSIRTRFFILKAKRPSSIILYLSALVFALTIALPFTSFGHKIFSFITPKINHLYLIFLVVIVYLVVTEGVKLAYYHFSQSFSFHRSQ